MKRVELVQAAHADAAALAEIHIASRAAAMPWLAVVHSPEDVRRYFAVEVLPKADVWVARIDGQPAGFMARHERHLDHLYLAPGIWRQGIGSLLLEKAREDIDALELWAFQRNVGARRFYEAHGFVALQFTDGAENEEREPDVRYLWRRPGQDGAGV